MMIFVDFRLQVTIDPTLRPPTPPTTPQQSMKPICKCQKCDIADNLLYLKTINDNNSLVISCSGYPECRHSIWLPMDTIREAHVTDTPCTRCGTDTMKICFKFRRMQQMCLLNSANIEGLNYTSCLVCDNSLRELLDIDNRLSRTATNATTSAAITTNNVRTNVQQQRNTNTTTGNNRSIINNNQRNTENNSAPIMQRPSSTTFSTGSNNRTNSATRAPLNSNPGNVPIPRSSDRPPPPPRRPPGDDGSGPGGGGGAGVICTKCGSQAQKRTVRKEGPNTGREFYNCTAQCNFFQWANAAVITAPPAAVNGYNQNYGNNGGNNSWTTGNNSNNRGARNNTSSRTNRGGGRDNFDGNNAGESRKRKCGLCRQEGHTRIKCPRQNQYDY